LILLLDGPALVRELHPLRERSRGRQVDQIESVRVGRQLRASARSAGARLRRRRLQHRRAEKDLHIGRDGLHATREFCKRWPRSQRPRIVALTVNVIDGDRERCLDAGLEDFLSKPIDPIQLRRVLDETVHLPVEGGALPPVSGDLASPVLDPALLARLRTDLGVAFPDVTDSVERDTPTRVREAREALARGDAQTLERAAHTLKSVARTVGGVALGDACEALERTAADGSAEQRSRLLTAVEAAAEAFVRTFKMNVSS